MISLMEACYMSKDKMPKLRSARLPVNMPKLPRKAHVKPAKGEYRALEHDICLPARSVRVPFKAPKTGSAMEEAFLGSLQTAIQASPIPGSNTSKNVETIKDVLFRRGWENDPQRKQRAKWQNRRKGR